MDPVLLRTLRSFLTEPGKLTVDVRTDGSGEETNEVMVFEKNGAKLELRAGCSGYGHAFFEAGLIV